MLSIGKFTNYKRLLNIFPLKKGSVFAFLVLELMLVARRLLLDARINTVTDAQARLDARNTMLELARCSKN